MATLTPDLDPKELEAILAQSERAANQQLGSSLLERLGGAQKAQEIVEKLKAPSSPLYPPKYAEEAAKGAEFLESIKTQGDPSAPEFAGKRAQALSKQAAAAVGTKGEGVISNIETPAQRKMSEAAARSAKAAAGTVGEGVVSDLPLPYNESRMPLGSEKDIIKKAEEMGAQKLEAASVQAAEEMSAQKLKAASAQAAKELASAGLTAAPEETSALSRILSLAKTPAGSKILKGLGIAGKVGGAYGTLSSFYGDLAKNQETPYQEPPVTPSGISSSLKSANKIPGTELMERQSSSPLSDVNTEGEIIKAALSQPQSLQYTQALQKRKQERERYVSYLNNSNLFSVEKDRLLAEYDEQYPLEKEANQDVESLNQKKTALQQKITQTESDLAKTSGPFSSDRLNKQLESYRKELAGLSSPQVDRMMAATPEPSANSILSELEQGTQSQLKPSSPVAAPKPAQDGVMTKTATGTGQPTSAGIAKQDREDDLTKVIGAESARKVSEYEDLMRRFQEAQDRANQMRMMAGIGEGAELLGASIAGVKPTDASFYRQMAEQADLLPKQFKEAEDFKKETRRNDPNSEESESARNLLKSQGITVPDNISAAFIEKQYPQFANILARKEAARLEDKRIRERQEDKDEERVRREKLQLNEDQNKYLDQRQRDFQRDKTQDAYLEVKRALDQIDDYLKDPNPVKAGALSTYLYGKINDPTSAIREQEQKLFGKAGSILDQMKQFASMAATGKIPAEKANQFKSLVNTKLAGYETSIKQKLDPLVEGGKRYQLSPVQVVSNLAGPAMWKRLYETPLSEKKSTIKLDTKLVGKAGKSFTDPKTGKRYIVNPDEESATEL